MKKAKTVNIAGAFEAEALRILRQVPGLDVRVEPYRARQQWDAVVRFADKRTTINVEFKQQANAATARQLVHRHQEEPQRPLLLIAGKTTAEARQIVQEHGIAFVDGLGNAHIELPGLFLHVEGRGQARGTPGVPAPTRLRGKAGLIAQALLIEPTRDWQVKALAEIVQVSVALVHRVLTRLEGEGIITTEGTGPKRIRHVTDPTALLDLWAEENVVEPNRILAYRLAQTPQQLIEQLGEALGQQDIDYALTGAAAASRIAPFITAIPIVEVWVQATAAAQELYEATGASPVADGQNVVFLQAKDDAPLAFREQDDNLWLANRFRLYADLRRDPRRGREQADHLRQEMIGF